MSWCAAWDAAAPCLARSRAACVQSCGLVAAAHEDARSPSRGHARGGVGLAAADLASFF
jgi:hypothetical protein